MGKEPVSSTTTGFNKQTPGEVRESRAENRAAAAEIAGRAYDVGKRADEHFQKHRADWVTKEYGKLVANQGPSLELRPESHEGRKLTSEADGNVTQRHSVRQARIALARRSMIRDLDRDDGKGR